VALKTEAAGPAQTALKQLKELEKLRVLGELPFSRDDLKKISKLPPNERPPAASGIQYCQETNFLTKLLPLLKEEDLKVIPKKV